MSLPRLLLLAGLVLILATVNWTIATRERLRAAGEVVYLELAPVDPRSLMQSGYMALRYKIDSTTPDATTDGFLIVRPDNRRVARASGWNSEPASDELRLK